MTERILRHDFGIPTDLQERTGVKLGLGATSLREKELFGGGGGAFDVQSEIVLDNLSWKRSWDMNLTCPQICRDQSGVKLGGIVWE